MIIVKLCDQLGNQMFAYAAAKTIAYKKMVDFKYYRVPLEKKYINDADSKYGSDIETVFCLDLSERANTLPVDMINYNEPPMKKRNYSNYASDVQKEIPNLNVMDV